MAREASLQEAKQHTDNKSLLLKLIFHIAHIVTGALGEQELFFPENFKVLPKTCALKNCILAGKEVLGRAKSAAWLSSGRGRTAGVELGCMDHCWLTLQKFTVILKINGPSN